MDVRESCAMVGATKGCCIRGVLHGGVRDQEVLHPRGSAWGSEGPRGAASEGFCMGE